VAEDGEASARALRPEFEDPGRAIRLAAAYGEIDRIFAEFRERVHAPGVAYGVVVDGELAHAGAHGLADVEAAQAAAPTTIFRIASMTKSVTAVCCLALRDQGRLGLDDPVVRHLPEAAGLRPLTKDSPAITIRHLLTMSAGLVTDDPWGDRQLAMAPEELDRFLGGGVPLNRPAGVAYEYSNLGYAILGRIVARVTGMPFADFAAAQVLGPLGMGDSHFDLGQAPAARRARGYRWEDGVWSREVALGDGAFGPMGGLWTTIEDFARYVAFHLDAWPPRDDPEGGPLTRSSRREMQQGQRLCWPRPEWMPAVPSAYGYGLVTSIDQRLGLSVAHSGGLPGFGSRVCLLPHHGVGVIGFANVTYAPAHEPVGAAIQALAATGALQPRVTPPSAGVSAAREWVERLYCGWDAAEAERLAAPNLFADRSGEHRRRELAALRGAHGALVAVEVLVAHGALSASWRMRCERGSIGVSVSLAPTTPPRVQALTLTPSDP